jgi:NAD(P)-dependent dehydrogenase (short-subunit alcohol dehydrogenase family)
MTGGAQGVGDRAVEDVAAEDDAVVVADHTVAGLQGAGGRAGEGGEGHRIGVVAAQAQAGRHEVSPSR